MENCDVLIVGGGPAGASCAWALQRAGLDVAVLDQAQFPRDKVCAGWITPPVLTALEIDPQDYGRDRVLQPIKGFRARWPAAYMLSNRRTTCRLVRRAGCRALRNWPNGMRRRLRRGGRRRGEVGVERDREADLAAVAPGEVEADQGGVAHGVHHPFQEVVALVAAAVAETRSADAEGGH